mgnify:CR=1 FL=1
MRAISSKKNERCNETVRERDNKCEREEETHAVRENHRWRGEGERYTRSAEVEPMRECDLEREKE